MALSAACNRGLSAQVGKGHSGVPGARGGAVLLQNELRRQDVGRMVLRRHPVRLPALLT